MSMSQDSWVISHVIATIIKNWRWSLVVEMWLLFEENPRLDRWWLSCIERRRTREKYMKSKWRQRWTMNEKKSFLFNHEKWMAASKKVDTKMLSKYRIHRSPTHDTTRHDTTLLNAMEDTSVVWRNGKSINHQIIHHLYTISNLYRFIYVSTD